MKILCVIDSLGSGGAQRQLVELAIGFKENGNEVSFLTYHNLAFFNLILEKAGIVINCIEEPIYLKRLLKIRKYVRRGKFDSVLSFLEAPSFICEFAGIPKRKWKLVVGERRADSAILSSFRLVLYRWFHVFADFIVSNSYTNIQYVHSVNPLLSKTKCKVIYNIVDKNRWKPLSDFVFRKDLKIKLIIAASLIPRKNVDGLIEALILLSQVEIEKISIEWYGDRQTNPYNDDSLLSAFEKIKKYRLEKTISFFPATHDITRIIQESDAVGLFSFSEGLPNIVCEGMSCGKPIICSTVSDVPDLLLHDKNLLCDPADPQSIKEALSYLISLTPDQLLQIGSINLRIAKERFEKGKIIDSYLKLLNK